MLKLLLLFIRACKVVHCLCEEWVQSQSLSITVNSTLNFILGAVIVIITLQVPEVRLVEVKLHVPQLFTRRYIVTPDLHLVLSEVRVYSLNYRVLYVIIVVHLYLLKDIGNLFLLLF